MKTELQRKENYIDLLSKFENGKERFHNSALFNKVIKSLASGAEPLAIIDQLITITEKTQKEYSEYIRKKGVSAVVVSEEQFNKLAEQ